MYLLHNVSFNCNINWKWIIWKFKFNNRLRLLLHKRYITYDVLYSCLVPNSLVGAFWAHLYVSLLLCLFINFCIVPNLDHFSILFLYPQCLLFVFLFKPLFICAGLRPIRVRDDHPIRGRSAVLLRPHRRFCLPGQGSWGGRRSAACLRNPDWPTVRTYQPVYEGKPRKPLVR